MENLPINQLYGSDSLEAAEREIQYFFPPQNTLAVIKPQATHKQRGRYLKMKANVYIFFKFSEIFQTTEKLKE